MSRIYDFEKNAPPSLRESVLQKELDRRRLRFQTALLAAAGILMELGAALLGFLLFDRSPLLAALTFLYVIVSVTGGAVFAVIFTGKAGKFEWQEQIFFR